MKKLEKILSYGKYCLIVGGLVLLAIISGCVGKLISNDEERLDNNYNSVESGELIEENQNSDSDILDLYLIKDLSEEEIIEGMELEKSEFGMYPSEDDINILCLDGYVYSLMISENDKYMFTLCGLDIGDDVEEVGFVLGDAFTYIETYEIEGGKRDAYIDNQTEYSLAIDYDSAGKIFQVAYVKEVMTNYVTNSNSGNVQMNSSNFLDYDTMPTLTIAVYGVWDSYNSFEYRLNYKTENAGILEIYSDYYNDNINGYEQSSDFYCFTYDSISGEYLVYNLNGGLESFSFVIYYDGDYPYMYVYDSATDSYLYLMHSSSVMNAS